MPCLLPLHWELAGLGWWGGGFRNSQESPSRRVGTAVDPHRPLTGSYFLRILSLSAPSSLARDKFISTDEEIELQEM